jgi:ferredoxin-thioredoxin reductase catalytic subunit
LNPDQDFLNDLLEGLKKNEERYGYPSCPCRLASGKFDLDKDIVCPCDYRDPDADEFGACYCGLYVRKDVFEGKTPLTPVPERRPLEKRSRALSASAEASAKTLTATTVAAEVAKPKMRLWYCKQCGYVVFREEPPYVCPICKAKREFFAEINVETSVLEKPV